MAYPDLGYTETFSPFAGWEEAPPMTIHMISGRNNSAVLRYFNSDVGSWADFPVNKPNAQDAISIVGTSMSNIWVGGFNLVSHWNGTSWVDYPITDVNTAEWCNVGISPDGSGVFVGTKRSGINYGDLYRFEGSGFVWKQQIPYYGVTYGKPVPVSYDECYLVASTTYLASGPDMYRWTSGGGAVREANGVGLPNDKKMAGITRRSSDGMIFLLDQDGVVYRGVFGGPWVVDNTTDGPFSLAITNFWWNNMSVSANGFVAVGSCNSPNYMWVRRENDDWVGINMTGAVRGEPALAGYATGPYNIPQYLLGGDLNNAHYSDDGGATGQDVPPNDNNDYTGAWAWGFVNTDTEAPQISSRVPTPDGSVCSYYVPLSFHLTDAYGINENATIVAVDGYTIWENDAPTNGYAGDKRVITDGYSYFITPPAPGWADGYRLINVYAEDAYANSLDAYFGFTVLNTSLYTTKMLAVGYGDKRTLLVYNTAAATWEEFSPQPPWSGVGGGSQGVVATCDGSIFLGDETTPGRMRHYDPITKSWSAYTVPGYANPRCYAIDATDKEHVWACISDKIYFFDGLSYTLVLDGNSPMWDIWAYSTNCVWAVCGSSGAAQIWEWDGSEWYNHRFDYLADGGQDNTIYSVCVISPTEVYIGNQSDRIWQFNGTRGGGGWTEHGTISGNVKSIWGTASDNLYALDYQLERLWYYNGIAWANLNTLYGFAPTIGRPQRVRGLSASRVFVCNDDYVGVTGGIYDTEDGWATNTFYQYDPPFAVGGIYDFAPLHSPPAYITTISIDEGSGYNQAYNGVDFIFPYNNNSSVTYDESDGYEGYNFIIRKEGLLAADRITIAVNIDGYEDHIYNLVPESGAIDVPRTTQLRFRIRGDAVPITEIVKGFGGWID